MKTRTTESLALKEWAPWETDAENSWHHETITNANLAYQSRVLRDLLVEVRALRANSAALMIDGLLLIVRDQSRRIRAAEQKRRKARAKARAAKRG